MRHFLSFTRLALLAAQAFWAASPAMAQPTTVHPAASTAARSSASVMAARANANANNAVGNPYINPNVAAGGRNAQSSATANANAAEMRSSGQNAATP